jgi:Arc/MetJ family transcription regulator
MKMSRVFFGGAAGVTKHTLMGTTTNAVMLRHFALLKRNGRASLRFVWYNMRMKRTNLVLDEQLLEEAVRLGGARTYSQAVNDALADYTRRIKARKILQLAGCGLWEGNLAEMRADRVERRSRKAAADGSR